MLYYLIMHLIRVLIVQMYPNNHHRTRFLHIFLSSINIVLLFRRVCFNKKICKNRLFCFHKEMYICGLVAFFIIFIDNMIVMCGTIKENAFFLFENTSFRFESESPRSKVSVFPLFLFASSIGSIGIQIVFLSIDIC